MSEIAEQAKRLLIKLLEYIEEQAKTVDKNAYKLPHGNNFTKNQNEICLLPGIKTDIQDNGEHIWLKIERLLPIPPPLPNSDICQIVKFSDIPFEYDPHFDAKKLNRHIESEVQGLDAIIAAEQKAKIGKILSVELSQYILKWHEWSEMERPRRESIDIYSSLFSLKHQIEAEETAKPIEFCWGIGVSSWKIPSDGSKTPYLYPLITQTLEIEIDQKSMAIEVRPREVKPHFEIEPFIGCSIHGSTEVEQAVKQFLADDKQRTLTPFDISSFDYVLKLVASNLDKNGAIKNEHDQLLPSDNLIVTPRWVLFSRPRKSHFLTDDIERLRIKVADLSEIPGGPLSIVSKPSDKPIEYEDVNFRGVSSRGTGIGEPIDLYFPLPYNDEQVTIIKRLERSSGVTVQGPPGTGKTHTIANVICHYLATGKRILVTSRGEKALEVLQSKIPENIRPLTVSLMSSDREGVRQFQASIQEIQHQISQLNVETSKSQIADAKSRIDRAHHELFEIDRKIDKIAAQQFEEVQINGEKLNASKLADLVLKGADKYSWFDDVLTLRPENEIPIDDAESMRVRDARRVVGEYISYLNCNIPALNVIPTKDEIINLHQRLVKIGEIERALESEHKIELKSNAPNSIEIVRELLRLCDEAIELADEIENVGKEWPTELRKLFVHPSFAAERAAFEELFIELQKIIDNRAIFLKQPILFPKEDLRCEKTRRAIDKAVKTGKPFSPLSIGLSDVKKKISAIRIAGEKPSKIEHWVHVDNFIRAHDHAAAFVTRWNHLVLETNIPQISSSFDESKLIIGVAQAAKSAYTLAVKCDKPFEQKYKDIFQHHTDGILSGTSNSYSNVRASLNAILDREELLIANSRRDQLKDSIRNCNGRASEALLQFYGQILGKESVSVDEIDARFNNLVSEIEKIHSYLTDFSIIRDASRAIRKAGGLKFSQNIEMIPAMQFGDDDAFPINWKDAWIWARIRSHLDAMIGRDELIQLSQRRRDTESALARLYKEMVAKSAWLATKRNSTPKVLQALAGYSTAIRRIGQGTGPNAVRYRRDAREAMQDAVGAVPCWIMNHSRISEAMPPEIGEFDLVIVDEASQSDLWALPAILRGKKILVVGDDKQVSPDGGFLSSEHVQDLKDRFLMEQPYGAEMTPDKSLYDLAARVFAANQIMLREHFRCVPAIISYSNRMFYKNAIQPLRIPKASERLDPPLIDLYVEGGFRNKRDINEFEAKAIANEITYLLNNSAYENRTIGVVSLLGIDQAKHIDSVVRSCCDYQELMRRKFECGDARTFQGSERDIMFLSMVVDAENCKALSGNQFDQRFNVATSRARDRMYLVRSVELHELSDKDIRASLLGHFAKPIQAIDGDLKLSHVEKCESGFEREVYSILVKLGYRVIPQVAAGSYRIDMVVEGENDARLAIELDGDEFHGPDKWQQDMNRQRILERAGWIFWRCFASTWSLHKDDVLEELIGILTQMGISPIGALEHSSNLIAKRVVRFDDESIQSELTLL